MRIFALEECENGLRLSIGASSIAFGLHRLCGVSTRRKEIYVTHLSPDTINDEE